MPVTYLDTVVYSEMDGRAEGRPDAQLTLVEEQVLRDAMRRGIVLVRPSVVVLDELVAELGSDRAAVVRKLRIMRGLGNGFQGMLKAPATLLQEAIQAYANGAPPPDVLLPEEERRGIVRYLSDVCAGSTRWDSVLVQVMGEIQGIKETWRDTMREAQAQALGRIGADPGMAEERQTLTFQGFFEAGAESLAEGFADPLGCAEACRRRGLDGLLRVPALRLCVGVAMSQIYAQIVGEAGQPQVRLAHRGDGYDIWHAILGSTTEAFVTFDQRLAKHLERIPKLDGPELWVVRSLRELPGLAME